MVASLLILFAFIEIIITLSGTYPLSNDTLSNDGEQSDGPEILELAITNLVPKTGHNSGITIFSGFRLNSIFFALALYSAPF